MQFPEKNCDTKMKNQNMIRLQLSYEKNFDFLLLYFSKNIERKKIKYINFLLILK